MNPYKNIWTKTAATIDYVLVHGLDNRIVNLNFFMAGLAANSLRINELIHLAGFYGGMAAFLVQAILLGLLLKYLLSYIYFMTGKIWKGNASFKQIVLILSLSLIPEIIYLIYAITILAVKGEVVEINYLIQLIGWVFSIRILVIGLSKIQNFNYGLAILNVVLPAFIVIFIQALWGII